MSSKDSTSDETHRNHSEELSAERSSAESTLGRTIVSLGLATEEEIAACLKAQREMGEQTNDRTLADLLVERGVITERQLKRASRSVETQRSMQQIPGYQLLEKIGSGAMATVFKARQISLDRIVAVKVLPKKHMSDPEMVDRFYAEGRAAAQLNHANIVQAIEVGKAGDFHYFVMEYVEGHSVYEHLRDQGSYEEPEALDIIIQIADALNHVHSKGMMHRDVKPKNIMITRNGVPKLADMGLAREVTDVAAAEAEAGKAYGTPYYISPEQIRGDRNVDFRADIYGLGATFYHMVTGRVPFEGPNPSAVMHKHLKEALEPPDHVNSDLSQGVSEIIEVMMAKIREERYASTGDLLEDLRAVARGEPPLQARRKFELAKLMTLEQSAVEAPIEMQIEQPPAIWEQPLFWALAASVLLNIVIVILFILR
jgi:serine/threonine-protein kinase